MDKQLLIFEDEEFQLENWRAEVDGLTEEFCFLSAHSRKHQDQLSAVNWKLGDCLLRGKEKGQLTDEELQAQVAKYNKMPISTIWDYLRVARRFRDESRRRELLSWSHHKDVAPEKFSDEAQDALLDLAEKKGLSVIKLRAAAKEWEKKEGREKRKREKLARPGGPGESVEIRLSSETFKLLKKLANARRYDGNRTYTDLLRDIVTEYFDEKRDSIAKEIEDWEARISEGRKEAQDALKADKQKTADLMAHPVWKAVGEYNTQLAAFSRQTGWRENAVELFWEYVRRECGTERVHDIPVAQMEQVLTKIKSAGDIESQFELLKTSSRKQRQNAPNATKS